MEKLEAIHIEPFGGCNLCCKYCYNSKFSFENNEMIPLEKWESVVDQAFVLGCRDFGISGGEFFMYTQWKELLEYIAQKGVNRIAIFSNGMLIDEKMCAYFKSVQPRIEFRISFDGFENADLIRVGSDYKKVSNSLRMLEENGFPVVVNTVLTLTSMNDLDRIYELIKSAGIQKWIVDFPFREGRAADLFFSSLPEEKPVNMLCNIIKRYIDERPPFVFEAQNIFKSQMLTGDFYEFDSNSGTCSYIKNGMTIRPNGEVGICPTLNISCGNIKESSLKMIFESGTRKKLLTIKPSEIEKCCNCKYVKICGGGCRADALTERGSVYEYDPVACYLMQTMEKKVMPLLPKELKLRLMSVMGEE